MENFETNDCLDEDFFEKILRKFSEFLIEFMVSQSENSQVKFCISFTISFSIFFGIPENREKNIFHFLFFCF